MRSILVFLSGCFLIFFAVQCRTASPNDTIKVLFVTGGHSYDTAEFIAMIDNMNSVESETALKPDAWKLLEEGKEYDAIVFYDMWQDISEAEKAIFLKEFEKGTGMVFMHHSLGSHNQWPGYTKLIGGKFNLPEFTSETSLVSDYKHDIVLNVEITNRNHPVTMGVKDFEIQDEGYSNIEVLPAVYPLLKTSHPDCDEYIGWTQNVYNSRTVYLMGGHDKFAYENESFRTILENALHWTTQ